MEEGQVTSNDFTKDVELVEMEGINGELKNLKRLIPLCCKNNQLYPCSSFRNGSITINKAVNSPKSRFKLTIYDKFHEIKRSVNDEFRRLLRDEDCLLKYFEGKVRFELTAYTSEHIKRWLEIDNNSIMTILESEGNLLQKGISEVFTPINYSEERITLSKQDKLALLKGLD